MSTHIDTPTQTDAPTFDSEAAGLSEGDSAIISTVAEELDSDADSIEVFEGAQSGALYAAVSDGYQRATVTPSGLDVTHVAEPSVDEKLEPVVRVEPDDGETVKDAIDNLSFSGD